MVEMDTPVCDFVKQYAGSEALRLHMPGHKGLPFLGMEQADITEIGGADVLYQSSGILRASEENAAALFGAGRTVYSAEGASLAIRAMVYLTALYAARQGKKPCIAAGRNAHKVFITAAALLDVPVRWIFPETGEDLVSCRISAGFLENWLKKQVQVPTAVYLTSPDYLGNMADIRGAAAVCRKFGCLLLVDNAHGAYLRFLPESRHPLDLGADLCCDSAHKTLPVLTGGAYLHIGKQAPAVFFEAAERAMALFASTSPSYLILQSLDLANRYLASGYREKLSRAAERWKTVRDHLERAGYETAGNEPLKLTLLPKSCGYTGTALAELLERQGMMCEFSDPDHVVMMVSPEWEDGVADRVRDALLSLPRRKPVLEPPPALPRPEQVISAHCALLSDSEEIGTGDSVGRIMASPSVSCPPAIPIVSCGERIDETAVRAMVYYGMDRVRVIK